MKRNYSQYDFIFYASNIGGLGTMYVVSNLLLSLSQNIRLKGMKILVYLPHTDFWIKNAIDYNGNQNWKIKHKYWHNNRFVRLFFRAFEMLFQGFFLPKCNFLVVFGDFPLKTKFKQILLLQTPHLVNDSKGFDLYYFYNLVFKINHGYVHTCIVQTEVIKNKLVWKYPFFKNRVNAILMPSDLIFNKTTINVNPNDLTLFYPASNYEHKNHKIISKLLNSNLIEFDFNIKFNLTISLNEYQDAVNQNVIRHENIEFLGNLNQFDVKKNYLKSGILFFPSLDESYGFPLVEAMNLGLYILCSDLPFARVLCGDQAIYFDPNDESSITNAIKELQYKIINQWTPDWEKPLEKIPKSWDKYSDMFLESFIL